MKHKINRKILSFSLFASLIFSVVLSACQQTKLPKIPVQVSSVNDQIAFARQTGINGANIFIINPDGSSEQQVPLVYPGEDFAIPLWSPDGSQLLISNILRFDASENLLPFRPATVDLDGSNFNLLEPPNAPFDMYCATWSQDGSRILCSFGGDQPGIFSIRASDGGDPVRLTTNPYGVEEYPIDVAPDGSQFLFRRTRPGPVHGGPKPFITEQFALFVANMDGTGLRQITPYGLIFGHEIGWSHWSPDGKQIISATKHGRLFVVRLDGTGLTPIHLQTDTTRYFAFEPDWSPDGTRIVFCMFINGQEDIYTANPDGSDLEQVTNTPDFENGPDWGRDPTH